MMHLRQGRAAYPYAAGSVRLDIVVLMDSPAD
jgi:hypothetical protein